MGQGWLNLKETARANEYLTKALKIQPDNIEALTLLSKIYEKNGKIEEAMNILKDAIELQGGDNLDTMFYMGTLLRKLGHTEESSE
jgi:Tfp pilus assembly protein PilF